MIIVAEIFSKIIDATSHYAASHSQNVAKVAKVLSKKRGFCENEEKEFYLAGLLHDLGKLVVPNEILNKQGTLTKEEFDIVKQHPYYSHRILEQVDGFDKIALWVGSHHETLDVNGYPYQL
jgi:HD-GYP domain-containing protein (c-di-GMP phosphodiesterase class II)